jgi:hypothetical protein
MAEVADPWVPAHPCAAAFNGVGSCAKTRLNISAPANRRPTVVAIVNCLGTESTTQFLETTKHALESYEGTFT